MRHRTLPLLAALALAACGGLRAPAPDVVQVGLAPPLPAGGLAPSGPTLEILSFTAVEPFRSHRVAVRREGGRWAFAHYHRWIADPGALVAYHLLEHVSRADLFRAVSEAPAAYDPDYRLSGAARALYWDTAEGVAVLEVEVSLTTPEGGLLGFWVERETAPVRGGGIEAFLDAASRALGAALESVTDRLASEIRAAPAPGSEGAAARPSHTGTAPGRAPGVWHSLPNSPGPHHTPGPRLPGAGRATPPAARGFPAGSPPRPHLGPPVA